MFGNRSEQHLSFLVMGREVKVFWHKTDRYGRTVGLIAVDGIDAGLSRCVQDLPSTFAPMPESRVQTNDRRTLRRNRKRGRHMDEGGYSYTLAFSQTNQTGDERPENRKPVAGIAAQALREWLAAAALTEGRIFRLVRKGGYLGGPLSPAAVRDIVRRRAAAASLAGDFSAHSLRSGFATEATLQATPLAQSMAMSGHRSVQSIIGYPRTPSIASGAAHLMDDAPD